MLEALIKASFGHREIHPRGAGLAPCSCTYRPDYSTSLQRQSSVPRSLQIASHGAGPLTGPGPSPPPKATDKGQKKNRHHLASTLQPPSLPTRTIFDSPPPPDLFFSLHSPTTLLNPHTTRRAPPLSFCPSSSADGIFQSKYPYVSLLPDHQRGAAQPPPKKLRLTRPLSPEARQFADDNPRPPFSCPGHSSSKLRIRLLFASYNTSLPETSQE